MGKWGNGVLKGVLKVSGNDEGKTEEQVKKKNAKDVWENFRKSNYIILYYVIYTHAYVMIYCVYVCVYSSITTIIYTHT